MKSNVLISCIAVLGLLSTACKDKKKSQDAYDKTSLMTDLANQCIVPKYTLLLSDLTDLETKYTAFTSNQNASTLNDVRTAWQTAYIDWQAVEGFEFGPAATLGLKGAMATFPTDTANVLANITAGSYNLGTLDNLDAIGFSSLDFLLFRANALTHFNGNTAYQQYGLDVIQKMKTEISTVLNQWNSGFKSTFIASTGNESTSYFSIFINEFNKEYELCKNAKLGIPIGKQSLGIAQPNYIEAKYSGISLTLLKANVQALHTIFKGGTGIGCDDYLIHLEKNALVNTINDRFLQIDSQINALTGSLESNISTNPVALDQLYTTMQGLVVSIKTDMSSNFGVLITYQDNDGD